jgi:hypothetical protein
MDCDIEGFKEIDAQQAINICDKRERVTEDRRIFYGFAKAMQTP